VDPGRAALNSPRRKLKLKQATHRRVMSGLIEFLPYHADDAEGDIMVYHTSIGRRKAAQLLFIAFVFRVLLGSS
jgi:hypothetical protein